MKSYGKLKSVFSQIAQLHFAQSILRWDEAVMMPAGAGESRAKTIATLSGLSQKILVTKRNKKLLDAAQDEGGLADFDHANLQLMAKRYTLSACITPKLMTKSIHQSMASEQAWRELRAQNNWKGFLPYFKKVFQTTKEIAERQGDALGMSPYNALLDQYAPGFDEKNIDHIFAGLKQTVPTIIQEIIEKQAHDRPKAPQGPFATEQQKQLGMKAMQAMEFDFQHGRLDVSHHPFCGGTPEDVRITTRYNPHEFISSLMAVCHETGHGMYEQGLPREWLDQPVGDVNSMAMHESQSLMIEMQVCSSPAFFQFLTPIIQEIFGSQDAFTATNLYKTATQVEPGFIRVDADEVTYQMHIILRYEIEKKLFSGELSIQEVPAYWHELMTKYLGLATDKNFKDGVMQDVHWPAGMFGYFPAYSLGRLIAAQLFATFIKTHSSFFEGLARGNFQPLKKWLHENVYAWGSALPTNQLLMKVTGQELDSSFFLNHVKKQYLTSGAAMTQ